MWKEAQICEPRYADININHTMKKNLSVFLLLLQLLHLKQSVITDKENNNFNSKIKIKNIVLIWVKILALIGIKIIK